MDAIKVAQPAEVERVVLVDNVLQSRRDRDVDPDLSGGHCYTIPHIRNKMAATTPAVPNADACMT